LNKQPPQNALPNKTATNTTSSSNNSTTIPKTDNSSLYPSAFQYPQTQYYSPQTMVYRNGYPGQTGQTTPSPPQTNQPQQVLVMNPQTGQYSMMPSSGMPQPIYYYPPGMQLPPQFPQQSQQSQQPPKKN